MNPSEPTPPNTQPTKAWFDTLPTPNTPKLIPPPQPSHHGKRVIIIIIALLVMGTIAAGAFFLLRTPVLYCLTADDYELLTGQAPDPKMVVTENFYVTSLLYKNKTDQYVDTAKESNEDQVTVISQLFTYRTEHSSMIITLSGEYTTNDTADAAMQRIANLKKALIKKGVDESAIKTIKPTVATGDYELVVGSEEYLSTARVYMTVTSDPSCRQPN